VHEAERGSRVDLAWTLAGVGLAACVSIAAIQANADHLTSLSVLLAIAAAVAGATVARAGGEASISASFLVVVLAATFLGPTSACVAVAIAELVAALRLRSKPLPVMTNLVAGMGPALVAANLFRALQTGHPTGSTGFYVAVFVVAIVYLVFNYLTIVGFGVLIWGRSAWDPNATRAYLPSLALNLVLVVAGASVYVKVGLGGIVFALAAVFAFTYMAHLLERSRHRAEQYVSLSWGVLGGLLRALDTRDGRAARHAAAVARFARDVASEVGMSKADCELAHTAGLLHDMGHFALSDRVHERGRTLTEDDWAAIQRHPELGAEMLKDLGMYGPVSEIVRAHHERLDGRGYPNGLPREEIPEIARIIAVAEVYDTLTASDTYRTPMSSFEALRELRRVTGTQLDRRYVEVLADLLSGEGLEYRHADTADFDTEVDMERRINEAGA
jgi:putative nucleotidyltransferase with HDIG domain